MPEARNVYRRELPFVSSSSELSEMPDISLNSERSLMSVLASYRHFAATRLFFRQSAKIPPPAMLRKRSSELKTDRRRYPDDLSGRVEPAGPLISSEDNDVVGFLIRHQQKHSTGIDGKVARRHASSGFVADRAEFAARIDRENSDAVVTPVRTINKSTIQRNMNVGT